VKTNDAPPAHPKALSSLRSASALHKRFAPRVLDGALVERVAPRALVVRDLEAVLANPGGNARGATRSTAPSRTEKVFAMR